MTADPFPEDAPSPELVEFFTAHAAAWSADNADAVAADYAVPALIRTAARTTFVETGSELIALITGHLARAHAHGIVSARVDDIKMLALPDNAARVTLVWTQADAAGATLVQFTATYTLASEAGVWAIVAADAQGEIDAWTVAGWI